MMDAKLRRLFGRTKWSPGLFNDSSNGSGSSTTYIQTSSYDSAVALEAPVRGSFPLRGNGEMTLSRHIIPAPSTLPSSTTASAAITTSPQQQTQQPEQIGHVSISNRSSIAPPSPTSDSANIPDIPRIRLREQRRPPSRSFFSDRSVSPAMSDTSRVKSPGSRGPLFSRASSPETAVNAIETRPMSRSVITGNRANTPLELRSS